MADLKPLGAPVTASAPFSPPAVGLHGRTCELQPLSASHFEHLYEALKRSDLWDYMPDETFPDRESFDNHYQKIVEDKASSPMYFAVLPKSSMQPEGMVALMDINTRHRSLEIGHVIFSPKLQRTTPATEAIYLALQYSFMLGFTRVVWKCNDLNEPSKKAAFRMGFSYEGVHKRHMVVKGRVRDTAWFSMTLDTWPEEKRIWEAWLKPDNFDQHGRQQKSLPQLRGERRQEREGVESPDLDA